MLYLPSFLPTNPHRRRLRRKKPSPGFSLGVFEFLFSRARTQIIANVISRNIRGDSVLEDQCAWYGLSYLIDTTLGLVLAVAGLRILDKLANERDWAHLKHSGVYEGECWAWHWVSQCLAWLLILTVTKIIIYIFMWVCSEPLAWVGTILFAPFQGFKHFELLFVMIFFPGLLNVIYFWIADGYLKASADQSAAHEHDESGLEDKKESLLEDVAESELKIYQPAPWSILGECSGSAEKKRPAATAGTAAAADSTTPTTSGVV